MSTATVIALAGSPNAGKSCLFNALTGLRQKVANYPGVTVEHKSGDAVTPNGTKLKIIDLPGTYSLQPLSMDEQIAVDVLTGKLSQHSRPDVVVAVADATNLERTLGLVIELKSLGLPVITALNMMDLAQRRGLKLDLAAMEKALGTPVVATIATQKQGINGLLQSIDLYLPKALKNSNQTIKEFFPDPVKRFEEIERILSLAVKERTRADIVTRKIDRVVLHPVWGSFILFVSMFLMFQAVFTWAGPAQDFIEASIGSFGKHIQTLLPEGIVRDLLTDGVIAGVGSVLVFLPQILLLFLFINLLEGTGYMSRAAFILDQLMRKIGLQGRSFVPLLSSFACAIPGIMATRTIRNQRDRLITILIAPLMACSARLPVYTLLIGAFVPNKEVFGPFKLQGVVMFALFLIGILSAVIVAWVVKLFSPSKEATAFVMEMPTYKWPSARYVFTSVWHRALAFIKRAGTYILLISVGLWVLASFPKPPANFHEPAINYSIAGRVGKAIEPLVKPVGFDWRIATGLIPGFAAREVMVGALGTVFAIESSNPEEVGKTLSERLPTVWPLATGLSLLAWYIFAPQCLATIATIRRESNSGKWAFFTFAYMLGLAYLAAFLVYNIFKA